MSQQTSTIEDIEDFDLPPSSMPVGMGATLKGFASEVAARQLGEQVLGIVTGLGSVFDLSALDGITIACDYDAALTELDRGIEGLRPLSRSNSNDVQGVAMSPAVMRNGEAKTHLIFSAHMLAPLIAEEASEDDRAQSIAIIAHECAHVQITRQKELSIPELRFGTSIEGYERAIMFQLAEVCWDEYAACRLSAPFAPRQVEGHAVSLSARVSGARSRANAAIIAYRTHGDLNQLVAEAGAELCEPMRLAAYLLGGMDGGKAQWSDLSDVRTEIEFADYADLIDAMHKVLVQLWDTAADWEPTLAVFDPLLELGRRTFASGGIIFTSGSDDACRIDVPYSPETMPR